MPALSQAAETTRLAFCEHLLPGSGWTIYNKITLPDGRIKTLIGVGDQQTLPEACELLVRVPVSPDDIGSAFLIPERLLPPAKKMLMLEGDRNAEKKFIPYSVEVVEDESVPAPEPLGDSKGKAAKAPGRSAWVWQPGFWQGESSERGLKQLQDWGISTVYIFIPMEEHRSVVQPERLAAFIREATRHHVAVYAVDGDPTAVLPEFHGIYIQRTRAYAAYNDSVEKASRLGGVQYDIEPHSLPGFLLNPQEYFGQYLDLLKALRKNAAGLSVEIAVPASYLANPVFHGRDFLKQASRHIDTLVVMDYRTALPQIVAQGTPFLQWGRQMRKPVKIALEAGRVDPPTLELFRPATQQGEFWIVPPSRANDFHIGLLLSRPVTLEVGQGYSYVRQVKLAANPISFHRDHPRLKRVMAELERRWGKIGVFAGLAVHAPFEDEY